MNFDTLTLAVLIDKPVEDVFWAWANTEILGTWFVQAEFAPTPVGEGTNYRWTWAEGTVEQGEIHQFEPPYLIAFTFSPDAGVMVRFGEVGGRTMVQLVQTHSHSSESDKQAFYVGCVQGWTFYLTNLKSVLEAGIDLREHSLPELPNLVNV